MERLASIDIGTNTVLLLVAERRGDAWVPLVEDAEITCLGRGVDACARLDAEAMRRTVDVLARYAATIGSLDAQLVGCVATSAARDARNSREFFDCVRETAGLVPEVITGDQEARLVYASAWRDFGGTIGLGFGGPSSLAVLDVGGGSTEFTYGSDPTPAGRWSFQIGLVRLTERVKPSDPMTYDNLAHMRRLAKDAMSDLRAAERANDRRLIGVAGTVTTLAAVTQKLPRYNAQQVHGSVLSRESLEMLFCDLSSMTVAERAALPGMEPKRADVVVAGCAVVLEAMHRGG